MGDFLNELVAKNLGTELIIQPRRASIFESTASHSDLKSPAEPESIPGAALDEGDLRESIPARSQRAVRIAEEDPLTSSRTDLTAIPRSPKPTRGLEAGPASPRISPLTRRVELEHGPDQGSPLPVPTSLPATSRPVDHTRAERSFGQSTLQTTRAPELLTAEESKPKRRDKQSSKDQTQITAKPRIVVSEGRARETPVPRASARAASQHVDDRPDKPEVPVINVTIGRVEVRALPSPAPKRAAQAKLPTLSLDEYLQRRRNGGAR
jgi:hypothetical protein